MIILEDRHCEFLLQIKRDKEGKGLRTLSKKIYTTHVSSYKIADEFIKRGLIYMEKTKGKDIPKITKKGEEVCELISKLKLLLN